MGLTRTFWRPKGSASLAWNVEKGLDLSLKFARVVGQLSFSDFLARVDLDQGNGSAGNVNLVPPQSWELNFEAKKDLGAWGTTTLKLYGKRYQDYIEWIPLPGGVEIAAATSTRRDLRRGMGQHLQARPARLEGRQDRCRPDLGTYRPCAIR